MPHSPDSPAFWLRGGVGRRHALLALAGALLLVLGLASAARADSFTVTTTEDTNDGACTAEDCSLREAIDAANATAGDDTITLPAGTYKLALTFSGEDGNATGDLDIINSGALTIAGAGAGSTTIDATDLGDRVIDVHDGVTATISGVTITGGTTGRYGGDGGGVQNRGNLTLDHDVVSGNQTTNGSGGGVYESDAATLTVTDSTVSDNSAHYYGGGIYQDGALTVTDSTVSDNSASYYGGGIDVDGTATVTGSTISGNTANGSTTFPDGGGFDVDGTLTLSNSTVSGNSTTGFGGGIGNYGTTNLSSVTLASNSGPGDGANLYSSRQASGSIVDTIVADAQGGGTNCFGVAPPSGHNLEDDEAASCGFTGTDDQHGVDPKLGALADNGGPTQTRALPADSLAIDAGDDMACPASDQRGVTRPQGSHCDIGAYEAATPIVLTQAASGVGLSSATLNGTVNPQNFATSYHFEYGVTRSYGSSTPTGEAGSDSTDHPESADIGALTPGTTYHFRVVATNAIGTSYGADQLFTTTAQLAPSATTRPATGVGVRAATLRGTIDPHGVPGGTYRFDYGRTTAYGSSTTRSAGSGVGAQDVGATLKTLQPHTTYHFRVVIQTTAGTASGGDVTFTTARPPFRGAYAPRQRDRVSRSGRTRVRVVCPAGTYRRCGGRLALEVTGGRKRKGSGAAPIGSALFRLAPNDGQRVLVRLNRRGRRLVSSRGRIRVLVVVTSTDGAGSLRTRSTRITLFGHRKVRHRHRPRFTG